MTWALVTGATKAASTNAGASPWAAGALGHSVSVDDRVIVAVGYNAASGSPAVSAVSDGLGNTYRKEASLAFTAGVPQELSLWSAHVTNAGTPSFSVSFSGGSGGFGIGLGAAAYSGTSTASDGTEVDVAAKITSAAIASGTTSGSTSAANELVIGFYTDWGAGASTTAGSGYTARANDTPDSNSQVVLEDKDSGASSGVTVSSSVTGGDASHAATGVIVFKLASASGTTPSSSDSATLTDTANQIGVNGPADSSSATEAQGIGLGNADSATLAEQNAIALLTSDSAAFAEQVAIAAATSTSDTASVAESVKIALGATDSAQLGEAMALALAHQDSATLQELVSVALAIADAASLTESASVTQNGGNTPSASDSASLTDTATSTAHTSTSDIGTLAEQAAIALKVTDVASMTEQIGLGLIAADSAALNEQLAIAVANAATDSAALAEVQTAVSAALAAAEAVHLGESATVQVFSGGARDWVYVIFAPSAKWTAQAPTGKWTTAAPAVKWSASAPQQ